MSELVVDLRGETGESRRRRQRARAAGFVIVVAALYALSSDRPAAPADAGAGTTVAAILELTPPEFGDVLLGESSEARPILVMHRGGAPVRIVSVAPNDAVGFAVAADHCSGTLLQSSASCTVDIVFKPLSRGVVTGSWTIKDEQAAHEVRVMARGLARHLAVTPDVLNFSPLAVGVAAEQTLTVTNDGDVPIVVGGIGADAPFIVAKNCAGPLGPGDQCQAIIGFRPRTGGDVSGRVVIRGAEGAEEAALTASGAAFERPQEPRIGVLSADPKSPVQMTKFNEERTIAIMNVGNAPVTISRVRQPATFTRRVRSWLGVVDQCSERTLPPGAQCVVILKVVTDVYRIPAERLILDTIGTATATFEIDVVAPKAAPNVTP